ncbi:VTC domain-containing protein [Pseudomonadota bacterium]|nr:VTC domain-containing protein [Pseudomonadota bacterium]
MRSEKKFTFSLIDLDRIRDLVLGSNFAVKKAFNERFVNSLYMDSYHLNNYEDNLSGISNRVKARLRWYSDHPEEKITASSTMNFEIKARSNTIGSKLSNTINIKDNNIFLEKNNHKLMIQLRHLLPKSMLPFIDSYSEFSLFSSYCREYYEDHNGELRITIDKMLVFSKVNPNNVFKNNKLNGISVEYGVLEIKKPLLRDNKIHDVELDIQLLRPGRHSKYAVGINLVNN